MATNNCPIEISLAIIDMSGARMGDAWLPERALTRLAALGTLSRNAGEGLCKGLRSQASLPPPAGLGG